MSDATLNPKQIFLDALERDSPEERGGYLDAVCGDNRELRGRIEALLRAHEEGGDFLGGPAPEASTIGHPLTEQAGTQIGPYKLLQEIGEGGMGVVYMAEQSEPVKRRVALKIIKTGMDTRAVIARFEAERQALAMMDHPNIAKVLDAETTETGRPYFVMELVKGVPITQYCDQNQLTPRERMQLFVPICQAVQHSHQKGIIHRDLKPSNVLVALYDDRAVPKIIDFGVAKAINHRLTEKTMFTEYGQVVGTPEYMSPEQAQFNHLDVDTRTDVYSLGVLLYELLTGETPFDRKRLRNAAFDEVLRIIREEDPPRPSTKLSTSESLPTIAANRHVEPKKLSSLVHGELDWIVMKALEKDRSRRYETASKFAEDVEHYLHDEAVSACPPTRAYRFRKFAKRNKAAIAVAAATAAVLLLGIAGTSWQAVRASRERDRAVLAEAQVHEEAAIAEAVNDFLQEDLLGMASAAVQAEARISPDPNIKLRTLLDRAAKTIDERFAEQPRVKTAICQTIGNAYLAIGEFEKAETILRQAFEIRRLTLGNEHSDTLATMHSLAKAYSKRGRYQEAESLNRQTLEIRRRTLGERHPSTASSMQALGGNYMVQRRDEEAESLHRKALDIFRSTLGEGDKRTIECMCDLANNYKWQGRFEEAEKLLRETLDIYRSRLGDEHPDTLIATLILANTYNYAGRYKEAETLSRQTLEIISRTLGDEHPLSLNVKSQLASSMGGQGRHQEEGMLWLKLLEPSRRMYGDAHPYTLCAYANASWFLATAADSAQRDSTRAVELAKWTTELKPYKEDYWGTLGVALYRNGEYSDAINTLEKAREMRGGKDPQHQFFLAMAYWQAGRREEALQNYREAAAWIEEGDGDTEQLRFKDEAERLIKTNEAAEAPQNEPTKQEVSHE